ncbi:MAG TPA: S8 family serine peptidase [Pirellulales bacterium]|nr:S8 family serine peptidase [Pirellulales bacterium]
MSTSRQPRSRQSRSLGASPQNSPERRVRLAIEQLEELLLFSVSPAELTAADWRQQTFSLDQLDLQANDASFAGGMVSAEANAGIAMTGAIQAQQQYGLDGAGYSVAILDTGIDYNNPAFAGRYLGGWNFVDNNSNTMDYNGHGTHVAGIIGSADPLLPGIAPGVGIISLKVLDNSGSGTFGNVDAALQWVAAHQQQYHIAAVNMSLGAGNYATNPYTFLDADLQTLVNEGVFIAAASGNSYFSYGSQPGLAFPAIDNSVVSVGAVWDGSFGAASWANGAQDYTTAADQIASFTQRSSSLDILAPGAYVTSTYLNNSYASMAGTSMASPMVAAAAALVHEALDLKGESSLANESNILSILKATGVSIVDGAYGQDNVNHTWLTFKRLDVYAALESVLGANYTPPSQSPGNYTPPVSHLSPNAAFVASLYESILGRQVDTAGLVAWVDRLNAGMSRQQLIDFLWTSAEHRARQVAEDYQAFLHRAASPGEIAQWVTAFQAGVSEDQVADAFLHSPEYLWSDASNSAFVQKLFNDILGRAADPSGLATWTSALDRGVVSRGQLADLVLHSNERNVDEIGGYYQQFLGRSAGAGEKQSWATLVDGGWLSLPSAAQALLASQEFYDRAAGASGLGLGNLSLEPSNDAGVGGGGFAPTSGDFASYSQVFDGWGEEDASGFGAFAPLNANLTPFLARQDAYPSSDPSGSLSLSMGSSQTANPSAAHPTSTKPALADLESWAADDEPFGEFSQDDLDPQDEADLALLAEIRDLQQAADAARES